MRLSINSTTMPLNIGTRIPQKAGKKLHFDLPLLIKTPFAGDLIAEALKLLVVDIINCFRMKKSLESLKLLTNIHSLVHLYVLIFYKELYSLS